MGRPSARLPSASVLLRTANLGRSFSHRGLFAHVALTIDAGERIGLIGPNGSGKSTLLRLIAGMDDPDEGEIMRRRGLRIAFVPQQDDFDPQASVGETLARLAGEVAGGTSGAARTPADQAALAAVLQQAGFTDPSAQVGSLSGGWRKRLAIAGGLAAAPDLLLLDEPTNHLDLEGIAWLEDRIRRAPCTSLFVTHDRFFLERVATRIIELSHQYPTGTFEARGGYDEFLRRRDEFLAGQQRERDALANRVREDIAWLRQGAQARRTKAKSRIQDAGDRMDRLSQLRDRTRETSRAGIDFQASGRRSRKLLRATDLAKSLGGRTLFRNLSLELGPGDRLGLLGANGSGKTTLIRILTGALAPDEGAVERAEALRLVTFTQYRESLDPDRTLHESLVPVGDTVHFQGRAMHITTWAKRFLFRPEQLQSPVGQLSGGEQARVLIARLMLEPADVLILDEPTNDLDIPTLEVLEQSIEAFPGAVVLVTHDRFMLERLATELLWLDGRGGTHGFASFDQFEAAAAARAERRDTTARTGSPRTQPTEPPAGALGAATATAARPRRRLSNREQREWDGMESVIEQAERRVGALEHALADPATAGDHVRSHALYEELSRAQAEVARLYTRWAELESLQRGPSG